MAHAASDTMTAKEKRNAADRARYAAKQALGPAKPRKSRRQKPGKTPFSSFIKVKQDDDENYQIRKSRRENCYFVDLVIGPLKFPGRLYNWKTGQLQFSTSRTETMRIDKAFYTRQVRPIITAAIEAQSSKTLGRPYRLPKQYRFPPAPLKPSKRKITEEITVRSH